MRRRLESGKASFDRIFGVDYLLEKEHNVGPTNSIDILDATGHVEHWDSKKVVLIICILGLLSHNCR